MSQTIDVDVSIAAVPSVVVGDTVELTNGSTWTADTAAKNKDIRLKNEKGKTRLVCVTPNGKYQGGNQLRIERIIRPSKAEQQSNEALADLVVQGVTKLLELRPFIEELWHRFDLLKYGETIRGCKNRKEFCQTVLHRDPRTVRYMLAGGNPQNKRAEIISAGPTEPPAYERETTLEKEYLPQLEDIFGKNQVKIKYSHETKFGYHTVGYNRAKVTFLIDQDALDRFIDAVTPIAQEMMS